MSVNYTFSKWLIQQSGRTDSIGDLARYIDNASDAPLGAYRLAPWRKFLNTHNAPKHIIAAIDLAFDEWITKSRRLSGAGCDTCDGVTTGNPTGVISMNTRNF